MNGPTPRQMEILKAVIDIEDAGQWATIRAVAERLKLTEVGPWSQLERLVNYNCLTPPHNTHTGYKSTHWGRYITGEQIFPILLRRRTNA